MPWKYRKIMMLYILGSIALALAIIVLARNTNVDTELLGSLGVIGSIAILINNLPSNGNGNDNGKE